jgi:hypothetical protein
MCVRVVRSERVFIYAAVRIYACKYVHVCMSCHTSINTGLRTCVCLRAVVELCVCALCILCMQCLCARAYV